ncbi:ATP-binding protein [Pseudidiomarina terrestris]|uniref:Sensor protein n=1 Tax=Pseudidiomarina terrestris TaxID=2820060 RepID=A0AAW7QZ96_9GAMM|nr:MULTISPECIES: ATP-binding protein [unclassified Pseudidiomarina]MDN7124746.1 HAMP domain-containing protein [Pseudidiomarina sp. 1APP75-32.1]MDN7125803.1 HAMP domain-containing protein [Pseudidiomarina sp. 1APR75-33.1]MDN7129780.1 HAMP domain-containing protein [Pseudidiomarina sp. 1APR75-15]MDN7136442.1 HAMP domain-containing protein [Pseudidiomarina sp. 1ASP75-5]MDN7137963.1 HAMP domain-containing protein [Pseudidiomarina sp. 1ASP75-14]
MRQFSIVTRIGIALSLMVALTVGTLLASYWLSERADQDALAINKAGSLRMQSYRFAWQYLVNPESDTTRELAATLQDTWQHPVFNRLNNGDSKLGTQFRAAQQSWLEVRDELTSGAVDAVQLEQQLAPLIAELDRLVGALQGEAESRIRAIRLIQVLSLFSTIALAGFIAYWLRSRVRQPLQLLTQTARRIGQGDFTARVQHPLADELGVLATTLNKMNDAIGYMYGNLEKRVDEQTHAIQRSNAKLQFLYDMARSIIERSPGYKDFTDIIDGLKHASQIDDIELCLITAAGDKPYLQVQPEDTEEDPCAGVDCAECVTAGGGVSVIDNLRVYRFPLERESHYYGVLVARCDRGDQLDEWQQQLLQSVTDQLAIALSLKQEEEQVRRLALIQERTVIARELHDSLAQALSYLKIQVTRLDKAIAKDNREIIDDVSHELREGLSSAYRQLRELLTTFRLKVDGAGLMNALQTTLAQFEQQSSLQFRLDYQLANAPLAPHEEIHLLQIIREACQNAIHHSQGSEVTIRLQETKEQGISLAIEDDGVGIPEQAEKLNHYGLAIMQERSKHLGGEITITRRPEGGTGVYFFFQPDYLKERQALASSDA